MTTDPATARERLEPWTKVSVAERLACKGMAQKYLAGYRGWLVDCTNGAHVPSP